MYGFNVLAGLFRVAKDQLFIPSKDPSFGGKRNETG